MPFALAAMIASEVFAGAVAGMVVGMVVGMVTGMVTGNGTTGRGLGPPVPGLLLTGLLVIGLGLGLDLAGDATARPARTMVQ